MFNNYYCKVAKSLNTACAKQSNMGIKGLEPGLFVNLEGCGSQTDFYRDAFNEIKDAIPYVNEEVTGTSGMRLPYFITCSVGELKSDPEDYYAAVLTPGRTPYEWNITFNQDNPYHLGLDRTAGTVLHEYAHVVGEESEYRTEITNIKSLKKAGKNKIAELMGEGSRYKPPSNFD